MESTDFIDWLMWQKTVKINLWVADLRNNVQSVVPPNEIKNKEEACEGK